MAFIVVGVPRSLEAVREFTSRRYGEQKVLGFRVGSQELAPTAGKAWEEIFEATNHVIGEVEKAAAAEKPVRMECEVESHISSKGKPYSKILVRRVF